MSGITFGSVGDIIAVGEIAWSIAKALNNSRGSAKEYQSLAKELQLFNKALLQVVAVWQNYKESEELKELGNIIKDAIKDWRSTLFDFQSKLEGRYAASLAPGGTKNWLKDASKKVVWLREKEDVLELRRKLHTFSDTLLILSDVAQKKSDRLAEKDQAFRVQTVNCFLQESVKVAGEQLAQISIMNERMEKQAQTSEVILGTVKSSITALTHIRSVMYDIKSLLELFQKLILAQQSVPKGLSGHWKQAPVILELPTGKQIPIPLEWVSSWEIFDTILSGLFKKSPAVQRKILSQEFAIEDAGSGRDISRVCELDMSFRPGQKVDMSMIFPDLEATENSCPRCKTISIASAEKRMQCTSCKMWFQRLVAESGDPELHFLPSPIVRSASFVRDISAPVRVQLLGSIPRPGDFVRVRLLQVAELLKFQKEVQRCRQLGIKLKMSSQRIEESYGNWEMLREDGHTIANGGFVLTNTELTADELRDHKEVLLKTQQYFENVEQAFESNEKRIATSSDQYRIVYIWLLSRQDNLHEDCCKSIKWSRIQVREENVVNDLFTYNYDTSEASVGDK